jgi:hypothetical protein
VAPYALVVSHSSTEWLGRAHASAITKLSNVNRVFTEMREPKNHEEFIRHQFIMNPVHLYSIITHLLSIYFSIGASASRSSYIERNHAFE